MNVRLGKSLVRSKIKLKSEKKYQNIFTYYHKPNPTKNVFFREKNLLTGKANQRTHFEGHQGVVWIPDM